MLKTEEQIAVNTDRLNKVEHHIEVTNREMGELRDKMGEVQTDVKWLKKGLWWIIGVMISGFTGISSLILYHITK